MHELSVALSLVDAAEAEADRLGARVLAVHLRLGPLSGVVPAALHSSYEIACAGTGLEGSRLVIEEVPVVIYCSHCEAERPLASLQWFGCAGCGAPAAEVRRGTELELTGLEIEQ